MIKLLRIEFRKVARYRVFWTLSILYIFLLIALLFGIQSFLNTFAQDMQKNAPIPIPDFSLYSFPLIWHNLSFLAGFFKLFLGVAIIILVTNEFSFRTFRQNLICGLSKADLLWSKILVIGALSLASTLLLFACGMILGCINTVDLTSTALISKIFFLGGYWLEIFAYMIFTLFLAILIKRSGFTLGILLLYSLVIEPIIIHNKYTDFLAPYLPLKSIGNIIDIPNTALMRIFGVQYQEYIAWGDVGIVLAYISVFIGLSYLLLKKRDL